MQNIRVGKFHRLFTKPRAVNNRNRTILWKLQQKLGNKKDRWQTPQSDIHYITWNLPVCPKIQVQ